MNGFLHCALCFTKSNILQAYTHTYTHACWLVLIVWYIPSIYMAGSGRDHSSFKTFQVHDRNPTRSTEDTLAQSPRALRKMSASNPFLGGILTRLAHTHRQTNDGDEVVTACSSVAGVELLLLLYIYLCYNIIIVIISIQIYSGTLYLCWIFVMRSCCIFFITIYTYFSRWHKGGIKKKTLYSGF